MSYPFVRFDRVEEKPLGWVWFPFLARGKATILEGEPGVGKSTVLLDLVARLSRGAVMPGDKAAVQRPMRTLIVAPDHDPADLQRRAKEAGADLSCVFASNEASLLSDEQTLAELEDVVYQQDIDLLVLDCAPALLGKVRWRDESELREAIRPLIELARKRNCALLVLMSTLPGRGRLVGSCGIFSVALEVVDHPRQYGSVVLFHRRSNIGPRRDPVAGRLHEPGDDELVKWTDLLDAEISKPLGKPTAPPVNVVTPAMIGEATRWLEGFLGGKELPERVIFEAGDRAGLRRSTVLEAKMNLRYPGEGRTIDGRREWVWYGDNRPRMK